ncbi:hypothetical protein KZZ52_52455 [Dactylosporangium sp. AC04546]|uniref:hypothetical protein n=1 Tax=Dactylosporangium sp. AC04546 TaxID=2862460 RepID=UPI001EE0F1D0|nr:hypothetical protein [Dactylosporangium sp. AC04546]WVK82475.1 hypothetical protein KZZ52_52455 [Dactylosporangium sp. AC04546]
MSEFDDLINDAIGDFRSAEATIPAVTPGTAAVRATVRHRRTVRLTTLSVLGALLIAAPIAAFAADPHGNNPPPVPGDSVTPVPAESATPSPASPSAGTPASTPPDGVITPAQLGAVKVDFPAFLSGQCPTKGVKLATSDPKSQTKAWVEKVVHTDLDGDAALETAALVLCRSGEAPTSQVLAFDRDAAGNIVMLGVVVPENHRANIRDITARDGGGIIADISDFVACCGQSPDEERHQDREYGWDGTKFKQVAGPTVFGDPARVTDLQVTVTDVVLGPVTNGKRTGTAKVTVKNAGPNPSGRFYVNLQNCSFPCAGQNPVFEKMWVFGGYGSPHAPLAAGGQLSETITVTVDATFTEGTVEASVTAVGLNDMKSNDDTKPANNAVNFTIRAS